MIPFSHACHIHLIYFYQQLAQVNFFLAYGKFRKSLTAFMRLGDGVLKDCVARDRSSAALLQVTKQAVNLSKAAAKCESARAAQDDAAPEAPRLVTLECQLQLFPDDLSDGISLQLSEWAKALTEMRRSAADSFQSYYELGSDKSWKAKLTESATWEQVKSVAAATLSKLDGATVAKMIKELDEAASLYLII